MVLVVAHFQVISEHEDVPIVLKEIERRRVRCGYSKDSTADYAELGRAHTALRNRLMFMKIGIREWDHLMNCARHAEKLRNRERRIDEQMRDANDAAARGDPVLPIKVE